MKSFKIARHEVQHGRGGVEASVIDDAGFPRSQPIYSRKVKDTTEILLRSSPQ